MKGKHAGPLHLGNGGVDVESPVEVFRQLHGQVYLAMEGVVGAYWFPLSGDYQDVVKTNRDEPRSLTSCA